MHEQHLLTVSSGGIHRGLDSLSAAPFFRRRRNQLPASTANVFSEWELGHCCSTGIPMDRGNQLWRQAMLPVPVLCCACRESMLVQLLLVQPSATISDPLSKWTIFRPRTLDLGARRQSELACKGKQWPTARPLPPLLDAQSNFASHCAVETCSLVIGQSFTFPINLEKVFLGWRCWGLHGVFSKFFNGLFDALRSVISSSCSRFHLHGRRCLHPRVQHVLFLG